ncbi:MAG TPA: RelA/SpoT domain-containing protein [Solirubrobacterales bacterium]|nr:RelA/SpoT domain-containing protein [Solirubrobacterales bacterium]
MELPISKSQIELLGGRMAEKEGIDPADLASFREVLTAYGEALDLALDRTRDGLGVSPTSRIKSLGTTREKLLRTNGTGLKSMQDLAGMRIVEDFGRSGQDGLVTRLTELFDEDEREPKLIDRREVPSHGYRAVHVVVFPSGIPVEVQVRTVLQHEWANMFEKLADRVGRGIRYGEEPSPGLTDGEIRAASSILDRDPEDLLAAQRDLVEASRTMVGASLTMADAISEIEELEKAAPPGFDFTEVKTEFAGQLGSLRLALDELLKPDDMNRLRTIVRELR